MSERCEMIIAHHPDCECRICKAREDERCEGKARGTHEGSVRVCVPCGLGLENEGFVVRWDNDESPG